MTAAALVTWIIAICGGLFLLSIWLIEYDRDFQSAAATRLPIPVIAAHVLLALGGLVVWVIYLVIGERRLAQVTVLILAAVVALGFTMGARWIKVYRTYKAVPRGGRGGAENPQPGPPVPPERNFPLPVVIGHGVFALVTVALVVLTVLRAGAG